MKRIPEKKWKVTMVLVDYGDSEGTPDNYFDEAGIKELINGFLDMPAGTELKSLDCEEL